MPSSIEPLSVESAPRRERYDAVIVGSGPNGLAAGITIAEKGRSVLVLEAADTIGGGMRSAELTLPGFVHDVCSAIHPLGTASPMFGRLPLEAYGLSWVHSPLPLAHPLDDGRAVAVERSLQQTAANLGADAAAYHRLLDPLVERADMLLDQVLGPLRVPRHPRLMARFGLRGWRSAQSLAMRTFRDTAARGMFAGMAAHSVLPLDRKLTASVGLLFCVTAHSGGWPFPRGGSQQLADALGRYLLDLGGEIVTSWRVASMRDIPACDAVVFDTNPRQMSRIAGDQLPARFRRKLERFRHGPGVFKIDWALDGPIPWTAEACHRAATVHVGGTFEQIATSERAAWSARPADEPFVLVAQTSRFDGSRSPEGKHTGWAYCHVPHGSTLDMTESIESQMERFAPGFRERILARHVIAPADLERRNANCVGGDITGGVMDLRQLFTRPTARWVPYSTPNPRLFLGSSSTPPGAGVHGMCGYHAAQAALKTVLRD